MIGRCIGKMYTIEKILVQIAKYDTNFLTRCTGTSMLPTLEPDCSLVVDTKKKNLALGDIVLFFRGADKHTADSLIVHRVVRVVQKEQGIKYYIKGDNCKEIDGIYEFNEIIGVITTYNEMPLLNKNKRIKAYISFWEWQLKKCGLNTKLLASIREKLFYYLNCMEKQDERFAHKPQKY